MEKQTIFFIEASTGCTCCASENFTEGPYLDNAVAEDLISRWRRGDGNPLASQYAKYGRYSLSECEAEVIGDGRLIVDDAVWGPEIERRN